MLRSILRAPCACVLSSECAERCARWRGSCRNTSGWRALAAFERHVDVLDLGTGQQLLDRFFASHARLLVAAERHADPVLAGAVDPDEPRLDARCEAVRAVEVMR